MKSKMVLIGLQVILGLLVFVTRVRADGYRIDSFEVESIGNRLVRTKLVVASGPSEFERFDVVRVQRRSHRPSRRAPVILSSPFGFPAEFWELGADIESSFAGRIAAAGHDVWLIDSRTLSVPPGSCESGAVDCSPLGGFGIERAVGDIVFVRALAALFHPFKKPIVGGFSGGSSSALAAVDRFPALFAGLFLWEGTLYSADPAIQARNTSFCAAETQLIDAGVVADPSVQLFKTLFELAVDAPDAPTPITVFPPGTTNLQALLFGLMLPNADNPLNFREDFIRLVGDPFAATLVYSDLDRVLQLGPLVGTYAALPLLRDSHCAIGGLDDSFIEHLDAFDGDVLVYATGRGFGTMMLDTATLFTRATVTINYQADFGESDFYLHRDWVDVAVVPFLSWLDAL